MSIKHECDICGRKTSKFEIVKSIINNSDVLKCPRCKRLNHSEPYGLLVNEIAKMGGVRESEKHLLYQKMIAQTLMCLNAEYEKFKEDVKNERRSLGLLGTENYYSKLA